MRGAAGDSRVDKPSTRTCVEGVAESPELPLQEELCTFAPNPSLNSAKSAKAPKSAGNNAQLEWAKGLASKLIPALFLLGIILAVTNAGV